MDAAQIIAKAQELKHTAHGRVLFELMNIEKAKIVAQMTTAREPVDIFRLQGRAQQLDELIKLLNPENR